MPVILHFDHGAWRVDTRLGQRAPPGLALYAVHAVAADDVWAVGKMYHSVERRDTAAILHYDGVAWEVLSFSGTQPPPPPLEDVDFVTTVDGYEGWAVSRQDPRTGQAYFLHYDGAAWRRVQSINKKALLAVDMVSTQDGQAVADDGHHFWYRQSSWQGTGVWTPATLHGISMATETYGWAVGE